MEIVKPRYQPAARERVAAGNHQRAPTLECGKRIDGFGQPVETVGQSGQQQPAPFGQCDGSVTAFEQRLLEVTFERLDLVADRGRGHVQFGGGIGEAFEPPGGLERAQRIQRRQAACFNFSITKFIQKNTRLKTDIYS